MTVDDIDWTTLRRKPALAMLGSGSESAATARPARKARPEPDSNSTAEVIELVKAFHRQERRSIYTYRIRQMGFEPREFKGNEWFAEYEGVKR